MSPSNFEARLLEIAHAKGLLSDMDLQAQDSTDPSTTQESQLQYLIRSGRIEASQVQALAVELATFPTVTSPSGLGEAEDEDPELFESVLLRWKGYENLRPIGRGGGGMVYRARDPQLDRWVALKFLKDNQPDKRARLLREARAQARLDNPYVVKVYEVGEYDEQPYIAMQLVQGSTLAEIGWLLNLEQKVQLIFHVAEALHAAHQLGLIHLDIKPGNILVELTDQGDVHPYLSDFGLVRDEGQENTVVPKGTPRFASPEQLLGDMDRLDRRSDVYSLGATLYFLLSDQPPFDAVQPSTVKPIPLRSRDSKLPKDLEAITSKCLQQEPGDRYSTARALAEDLDRFLNHEPIEARPWNLLYRIHHWVWHHPVQLLLGTFAFLLMGAGLWGWRISHRAAVQTRLAMQYGQQIQAIEELLRKEHLARLHDRRPAVRQLRKIMGDIREQMTQLGSDALGPGSFALGQGYYLLGEIDEARENLDKAWSSGFQTAACAEARGQVMADLYLKAKTQIRASDPSKREEILMRLQSRLRDPALACFQIVQRTAFNTPYLRAEESYLRGDLVNALRQAEAASRSASWMYETHLLCHKIHYEWTRQMLMQGKLSEAKEHLDADGQIIDRVLEIAPSDPANWTLKGWWCLDKADFPDTPSTESDAFLRKAQEAFDAGHRVDEDYYDAYDGLSEVFIHMANRAQENGIDPTPDMNRAVDLAELGYQFMPKPKNDPALSWALIARAEVCLEFKGEDARADLDRAIGYLRKAQIQNSEGDVLAGLDTALAFRAMAAFAFREDPLPYQREAVRWAEEASWVDQGDPERFEDAMNRHVELAELELRLGISPSENLDHILASLERFPKSSTHAGRLRSTQATAFQVRTRQRLGNAEDPRIGFESSLRMFKEAVALQPDDFDIRQAQAEAALRYGRWLLAHKYPAESALQQGLVAAQTACRLNPLSRYASALEMTIRARLARVKGNIRVAQELERQCDRLVSNHPFAERYLHTIAFIE